MQITTHEQLRKTYAVTAVDLVTSTHKALYKSQVTVDCCVVQSCETILHTVTIFTDLSFHSTLLTTCYTWLGDGLPIQWLYKGGRHSARRRQRALTTPWVKTSLLLCQPPAHLIFNPCPLTLNYVYEFRKYNKKCHFPSPCLTLFLASRCRPHLPTPPPSAHYFMTTCDADWSLSRSYLHCSIKQQTWEAELW